MKTTNGYTGKGKRVHAWMAGYGAHEGRFYKLCGWRGGTVNQEIIPTDKPVTCKGCLLMLKLYP